MPVHTIQSKMLERPVRTCVVGCGGAGSAIACGLVYLHQALIVRSHPGGLRVTVVDGDRISATNCVRQPFSQSEISLYKSVVLVNRLNMFWGLDWEAIPEHLTDSQSLCETDIVIGCVDTRAGRAAIHSCAIRSSTVGYWLDLGNNAENGQFILGEPLNLANGRAALRLRTVAELYPEIVDPDIDDDNLPSCSALEALERQAPFVNAALADHALSLLAQLFRYGQIEYHGGFVNLSTGQTSALRVDRAVWRAIQKRTGAKATVSAAKSRRSKTGPRQTADLGNR